MGIRFKCHACGYDLHVKDFLAGKRSKCPACEIRFRIPNQSAELSIPLPDQGITGDTVLGEPATSEAGLNEALSASVGGESAAAVATAVKTAGHRQSNVSGMGAHPASLDLNAVAPPNLGRIRCRAIEEAPTAAWYVQPPSGGQYGPAVSETMQEWLSENRVTPDSVVWREGWPQWRSASEVFVEFFSNTVAAVSPAPPPRNIAPPPAPALAAAATTPSVAVAQSASLDPLAGLESNALNTASAVERARLAKKIKRRQQYTILIGVLAVVAIGLIIALAYVLMRSQPAPKNPAIDSAPNDSTVVAPDQ